MLIVGILFVFEIKGIFIMSVISIGDRIEVVNIENHDHSRLIGYKIGDRGKVVNIFASYYFVVFDGHTHLSMVYSYELKKIEIDNVSDDIKVGECVYLTDSEHNGIIVLVMSIVDDWYYMVQDKKEHLPFVVERCSLERII